jgi:hypothetical protein
MTHFQSAVSVGPHRECPTASGQPAALPPPGRCRRPFLGNLTPPGLSILAGSPAFYSSVTAAARGHSYPLPPSSPARVRA